MLNINVSNPKPLPVLLTLPFQISLLTLGIFFLTAFGALVVTANPVLTVVGLKISFFDIFVVSVVVFVLFILQ